MRSLLDHYDGLARFGHREHLHLAWSYIRRDGMPRAASQVVAFIKHVAAHHGDESKYNETMTLFWVYAVALAMRGSASRDFDRFLAENPHLSDKDLPRRHWTDQLLRSSAAKAAWVDPDLVPLPRR